MSDMVAMEAFLRDQIIIENETKLKEKLPLIVFCKSDPSPFEKTFIKIARKYNFEAVLFTYLEALYQYLINDHYYDIGHADLQRMLDAIKPSLTPDTSYGELNQAIIDICHEWSKKANIMVLLTVEDYIYYSHSEILACPIVMLNPSQVKQAVSAFKRAKKGDIHFDRVFGRKIDKKLYVKNPERMQLYHVSMTQGIKELEPRRTSKPLNDMENMAIARISATTSVDACFRAVSPRVGRWYVYQLVLTSKSQVVKPNTYLVPDADITGEYWVLTLTKVKEIAIIDCREDPDNKGHFLFDTIKSTTNEKYEKLLDGYTAIGG